MAGDGVEKVQRRIRVAQFLQVHGAVAGQMHSVPTGPQAQGHRKSANHVVASTGPDHQDSTFLF